MPSIVSNETQLLCRGIGQHRLMSVERSHSVRAVPSKVPDFGCPFAPEKATMWAIIRGTRGEGAGRPNASLSKEGTMWGRFSSSMPELNWGAMSILQQQCWS
jgi:hypothetical protein